MVLDLFHAGVRPDCRERTRLILPLGACVLSRFHWAHRFRHTLYDGLQIKHLNEVIALISYGVAVVGSVIAAMLLWQIGQTP